MEGACLVLYLGLSSSNRPTPNTKVESMLKTIC